MLGYTGFSLLHILYMLVHIFLLCIPNHTKFLKALTNFLRPHTCVAPYIRKTSKGLKRAFCPLKLLKLCFKAIKSLKIFKTRIFLKFFFLISLKIIAFSTFFFFKTN